MRRNVNLLRLFGNIYIVVILCYIALAYYVFMYKDTLQMPNKTVWTYTHIVLMHTGVFMLLFSFFQTIISDPGKVPLFWGFFLDDPDHKRRRYCLICHIFKPERSHHCSACNRCVLNMDHHCPWLNNCIGFYNRKFFLLLLFYTITSMAEIFIYYFPTWIENIVLIFDRRFEAPFNPYYLTVVCYLMNLGMLIVVSMFFRFHLTLINQNMTTIEHMDKKRGADSKNDAGNYDMGVYYNFIQIFGKNPLLWPFPVFLKSGKPVGDGVVWPQKPSTQKYEIDMNVRNVGGNTSEHGSAVQDRVTPMHGETDGNTTPFNPTPVGSTTHHQPLNTPGQSSYMMGNYPGRSTQYGGYENQPSERAGRYGGYGINDNYAASSYSGQNAGFDQTQQMDGYSSHRGNYATGNKW